VAVTVAAVVTLQDMYEPLLMPAYLRLFELASCFSSCSELPTVNSEDQNVVLDSSSLPHGLHSLSSLRKLKVYERPEIRSLPKGGLPSSLDKIKVCMCSVELHEQVNKLEETNPGLRVDVWPKVILTILYFFLEESCTPTLY
jgi:hypothetical protein